MSVTFEEAFGEQNPPIAVYGLGKIGAPLAAVIAEEFDQVIGVDIDQSVVGAIERGESPIRGEPGLGSLIETVVEEGSLSATTDGPATASRARIHVVIVPTVMGEDGPDLEALEAVLEDIGAGLDPGDLVAVESTLPPGTTGDVIHPTLVAESGLEPENVNVAYCPERTASGRAVADIRGAYPKVVGGVTGAASTLAVELYERLTHNEVIPVSDARTAECVKVFEGVYRDVNIALANELACARANLGVDVNEAIEVANTQPYCNIHSPGAGVGGHCIPVYPYFLTERFDVGFPLIETARGVNERMPSFVVNKIVERLEEHGREPQGARVLLLGVTYRAGVAETRNAPALDIASQLDRLGVTVEAADPVVDVAAIDGFPATDVSIDRLQRAPPDYDAIVVTTAHDEFYSLDASLFDDAVVIDGRQFFVEDPPRGTYAIGSGSVDGSE